MKPINERVTVLEILELTPNSKFADAKANFKRLAMQYHPDRNKAPEALEYMKKLNWANDIVKKMQARREEERKVRQQPQKTQQYSHQGFVINIQFFHGGAMGFQGFNYWAGSAGSGGTDSTEY